MVCMSQKVACVLICFAGNLELFSLYIGCKSSPMFLFHSLCFLPSKGFPPLTLTCDELKLIFLNEL